MRRRWASLPIVVVLPAPLIPYRRMHAGDPLRSSSRGRLDIAASAASLSADSASSRVRGARACTAAARPAAIAGPMSAPTTRASSSPYHPPPPAPPPPPRPPPPPPPPPPP